MSRADAGPLSLTEELARFLVERRRTGFPPEALEAAGDFVLDWLGCALAGRKTGPGGKLLDYAAAQPAGESSLVGESSPRSPEVAALTNGGLSHIVEMDDVDRGSVLHPGAVVVPAALAIAEARGSSGASFLAAVVAGYEVAIRIGEAIGKKHYFYFHNTSTCGGFGAAAAAAWLLGLEEEPTVWALGNAGTQASGLWEFNRDGTMSKHLHAGRAASNGALAALLAARGFTGPRTILEGSRGLFSATAPDAEPGRVVQGLGSSPLKIHGVSIKPHASCRHTHAAIDCALELRGGLGEASIASVEVDSYSAALDLCDRAEPRTPYDAKFSMQHVVALALTRGRVGLDDFEPAALGDARARELRSRTRVRVDPGIESRYPRQWPARVRLGLASGDRLEAETTHPKGDPERRLRPDELEAKFLDLASRADGNARSLLGWVRAIGTAEKVRLPR